VIVIVTLSIALWFWRTRTLRDIKRKARIQFNLNDRFWLMNNISFYKELSNSEKKIFEDRLGLFLAEIKITEIGKELPEKSTCFYVGSSAIITFWGLPYWNYGDLSEVLVYPENFTMENEINNRAGVQGKVHHGGLMDSTMILSLPALIDGFKLYDSQNVGIHEFAHLLDKQDESIDGIPFMYSEEDRSIWSDIVEHEIRKKRINSKIDRYALTNESEFFAVLMEVYRENPNRIKKKYPELYRILEANFNSELQKEEV
jgi:Mlc titration factor MtfA (ptsG expression regulator)